MIKAPAMKRITNEARRLAVESVRLSAMDETDSHYFVKSLADMVKILADTVDEMEHVTQKATSRRWFPFF